MSNHPTAGFWMTEAKVACLFLETALTSIRMGDLDGTDWLIEDARTFIKWAYIDA